MLTGENKWYSSHALGVTDGNKGKHYEPEPDQGKAQGKLQDTGRNREERNENEAAWEKM